jgi:L-erythrulose 1-phosphate isomerase
MRNAGPTVALALATSQRRTVGLFMSSPNQIPNPSYECSCPNADVRMPMSTPFYFGTNLKMNQTPAEAHAFVSHIVTAISNLQPSISPSPQIWLTLSFTNIAVVADLCAQHNIWLGAQNMHWADEGAFTGEISPVQLKAVGANLVMLGHAERRTMFGETDEALNKKVLAAAKHGLRVMLCVGETASEKQLGTGYAYVTRQLTQDLASLSDSYRHPQGLVVLYEPVWSVGPTGVPADPVYVTEAIANIRRTLQHLFGEAGANVPILYGGSVTADNCANYAHLPNCAGLGVGRAAWQAEGFLRVLGQALQR